ncbi:unnamed protein product [Meganyctiphanes norvegica]|uniref:MD-2-related lipid-recognition domain-containing protein n=1 Tax=Meganyctiphanes norvegica TaxID=48144 RepID=A0AAV2RXX3_MEGNR
MQFPAFIFIAITAVAATPFKDCGSLATGVQFTVQGCDHPPCIMHRGSKAIMDIKFTPSVNSPTLNTTVIAAVGGQEVPWPGLDNNGCHQLKCPLVAQQETSWHLEMDINVNYPQISTVATFQLIDAGAGLQVCAMIPVRVV